MWWFGPLSAPLRAINLPGGKRVELPDGAPPRQVLNFAALAALMGNHGTTAAARVLSAYLALYGGD